MASLLVRNYYILCFNATLPLTFYFSMAFILRQHGMNIGLGIRSVFKFWLYLLAFV